MTNNLKTTIGLEIHVQLKTKSKMFCRCDNQSFAEASDGKQASAIEPNTLVCPVCLGLPGALPVANRQAIEWTIKTGLAINSKIPKYAKFDRKHYFYPDLPKGYQISQYDEPFCQGGTLEIEGDRREATGESGSRVTIRFNRVHLEEDAGKLIHSGGKSLVDLNRAGTPLMEMVTEPDITSPKQAGDFLRRLQKLVRDEVRVSDADMEKGHMRCDANISVCETEGGRAKMSEIVEIKNLNSFKFVEKALALEEARLKAEYPNWKSGKVTRGYDSDKNITYVQRTKEEAADYRYFPEPDVPPIKTASFDLEKLRSEIAVDESAQIQSLVDAGIGEIEAKTLLANKQKRAIFDSLLRLVDESAVPTLAKAVVNNYFSLDSRDKNILGAIGEAVNSLAAGAISKAAFTLISAEIQQKNLSFESALSEFNEGGAANDLGVTVDKIIQNFPKEAADYKAGKVQLFGFFVGQAMKEMGGRADPRMIGDIVKKKLSH